MVEFGILALLFTLIMFAIADFGMLLNGWVAVSSAAREAGRRASMGVPVPQIAESARAFAPIPGVPPSALKVVAQYCNDAQCNTVARTFCMDGPPPPQYNIPSCSPMDATYPQTFTPGYTVRVWVIADTFEVITPLVRPFFGCSGSVPHCWVPIASSTTMRFEGPPPP
jgi:Flp pilus assembly protein TadG